MSAEHRRTPVAERPIKIVIRPTEEAAITGKGRAGTPLGEVPVVLTRNDSRLALGSIDVVTFAPRLTDLAPRMGDGVTEGRNCSPLSNCACPDASVPVDACNKINTEPGAHTCAPRCVEED